MCGTMLALAPSVLTLKSSHVSSVYVISVTVLCVGNEQDRASLVNHE